MTNTKWIHIYPPEGYIPDDTQGGSAPDIEGVQLAQQLNCNYGCCPNEDTHNFLADVEEGIIYPTERELTDEEYQLLKKNFEDMGIQRIFPEPNCTCAAEKYGRTGHSIWCERIRAAVKRGGREDEITRYT